MMEQKKEIVDVFLCHNGADKDWVQRLAEQIESETFDGTSSGRPLRAFFDKWDIDVGQNILQQINQALTFCRYFAVVISPEFLAAPWPALEWTHMVSDDPTNRKGRLVPLFYRDYSSAMATHAELPAPFKALNWIDFRRPADFRNSFQKLVRKLRDQPPARGRKRRPLAALPTAAMPLTTAADDTSAAPDRVSEAVLGNLLPVESYPPTVWSAPTEARKPKEVGDAVEKPSPFILEEKRLYTFADLSHEGEPLREVVGVSGIKSDAVGRWQDDAVRWRWAAALLNRCLRGHFAGLPIKRDEKGRYFFRPKDGAKRVWQNGDDPERTVADKKVGSNGTSFWVHHGATMSFQTLGSRLFLCIDPCYVFTTDGNSVLAGKSVGPLSIKWGGKERNAAILRHIVFWARTMAKQTSKIELQTGSLPIIVSGVPALARTTFGVEFDQIGFGSLLDQVEDELEIAAQAVSVHDLVVGEAADAERSDDAAETDDE